MPYGGVRETAGGVQVRLTHKFFFWSGTLKIPAEVKGLGVSWVELSRSRLMYPTGWHCSVPRLGHG